MTNPVPATKTGKDASNENFPVASWLVAAEHRPLIHTFYAVARLGDDIADDPLLEPTEKVQRLQHISQLLTSEDTSLSSHPASQLRVVLAAAQLSAAPVLDLLKAFTQDATKRRYANWEELLDYCRYSANPVGRFVLAVHGESPSTYPANDALCTVLQILNHLQDMADDYRENDRVYLPLDLMAKHGADPAMLAAAKSSPSLLAVRHTMLDELNPLLQTARTFPAQIKNFRLRLEVSTIVALAEAMHRTLRHADPLLGQSKLGKVATIIAASRGVLLGCLTRYQPSTQS